MIKLAIIGGENTHAWQFAAALDGKNKEKLFDDVCLIGVYADSSKEEGKLGISKIKELSNCTVFAEKYDDFVNTADAVMITLRAGREHLAAAEQYIKKGIPVWIDKPFTCSPKDARALIELADKNTAPISGGSAIPRLPEVKEFIKEIKDLEHGITGGHVTAPANMINNYGGFWFYTQHLVQMMTVTFGNDVKGVRAFFDAGGVTAIYFYDEYNVTARFGAGYSISVYDKFACSHTKEIKLDPSNYFLPELYDFYDVIKKRKSDMTYKEIYAPVCIIDATIESYTKNEFVVIDMN